jgi:TPR repeat protein
MSKLRSFFGSILIVLFVGGSTSSLTFGDDATVGKPADDTQIQALVRDRPALSSLVQKDNAIWKWLETAFAYGGDNYKIVWSNDHTVSSFPTGSQSSSFPDFDHVVTVKVDGTFKEGPSIGQPRPAEDMLVNLVFELNNARHVPEKQRITRLVDTGGISRDDFMRESFRQEFLAAGETEDFFNAIWVPFCKEKNLAVNPHLWGVPVENTFQERLAKYPPTFWYPWGYYGRVYDKHASGADDDFRYGSLASVDIKTLPAKAAGGDADSEEKMGVACLNGYTVPQDYKAALDWFSKATAQGNIFAEKHLAWIYDNGVGVERNNATATEWYLKAATAGDASAEDITAARLEYLAKSPQDIATAVDWYRKAALQGNTDAQDHYGYDLLEGHGLEKNPKQGFAYLLIAAARSGHARYAIAECYRRGFFVKSDSVEAYRWCLLAMDIDQQAAGLATQLKGELSPDQMTQATQEAANYRHFLNDHDLQSDALSIRFASGAPVTVPFEYVLHDILIPVQLDGQETKYLIVDTGSDLTLLDEEAVAGLKFNPNQYLGMGGNGPDLGLTRTANGFQFSIAGLTISGANVALLSDFGLDQYLGHPVAGILGYDILSRVVITIDYANETITFRKPGSFKPDATTESVPLFSKYNSPFIQAEIGPEADTPKGWFLVDTGDGYTVTLTKVFQEANPQIMIEPSVKTGELGFGGVFYSQTGKCPRIRLGKIEVAQPIATLESEKQGKWANLMGGTVGDGILSRFDATFDSPDGMLFLKPNARFSEPFTYNDVGMGIKTAKGDYHSFLVFAIVPDSPAALSKFQVGDQIVSIDKADAATMSLSDLYEIIRKEGMHHLAVVRARGSKEIDLKVIQNIK